MSVAQRARKVQPVVVVDPRTGDTVEVPVGSRLELKFTGVGLGSRWSVEKRPGHLVPLDASRRSFTFLVFAATNVVEPLVLRRVGSDGPSEARVIHVVPTGA